jgi:hypothetical protein
MCCGIGAVSTPPTNVQPPHTLGYIIPFLYGVVQGSSQFSFSYLSEHSPFFFLVART